MRITQFTYYNNFINNQQNDLNELNKIQNQISTGRKITYMNDNPVIFTKHLTLDEEINSLTQIKNSAQFAKTFANETDTILNEFSSTLSSFKTKLIQAANDTNNKTSRMAIVKELEGELNHLRDLANTSIDGKYIFSGSAFDKKPIGANFKYQGNDKKVKAFLGAGVEREYNIDGKSLFLGRDDDYKKHMSLNVVHFNKIKEYPNYVVFKDGKYYIDKNNPQDSIAKNENTQPQNIALSKDDTNLPLRYLTGITDFKNSDGTYTAGTNYFFIKGKRSDGSIVNTSFKLSNDDSIQTLLDKIGEIYGNTATTKNVDVYLNDMGEIQIKDLNSGKMITDFYMVAAGKVDKNQADPTSIEDLISGGYDIVSFQKSNFNSIRNLTTIKAVNTKDNKIFKFFSNFKLLDNSRNALLDDKLQDVIGVEAVRKSDGTIQTINNLNLSGTDTQGNSVNVNLNINSNTTMKDLINAIKNNFGDVSVNLENGEIKITDNSIDKYQKSNLSIVIKAEDSSGNKLEAFRSDDVANFNELYFETKGNENISNISQIIADKKYFYKNSKLQIDLNEKSQYYATNQTVIADTLNLSPDNYPQTIELRFRDINGDFKKATITLRDTPDSNGHLSTFSIDGKIYDILDENGNKTPAHTHITDKTYTDKTTCKLCHRQITQNGVTFKQLADVVSMLVTDNLPENVSYEKALKNAHKLVQAGLDDKGRFYLKDLSNNDTKIRFSMFSDNFSFEENNAITIDEPENDFFQTLQNAIEAVKEGNNFANSNATNPRNYGIQGAIEAIEHVMDRVRREHSKIGAVSNEFDLSIQRVEMLQVHVKVLQSDNIDTDIGEATMKLNAITTSYKALLASIAKINNLTLLNYLR